MKPQEALNLLDRVLQSVHGTRADHINIQQAIAVLQAAITPPDVPNKPADELPNPA